MTREFHQPERQPVGRHQSANLPTLWKPGEHIAIVGQTGSGKTFLLSKLMELRRYAVVFRTKPDDIKFAGFETATLADSMNQWNADRLLLKPKLTYQAREIWRALKQAWEHGGWTIAIDELWYAEHRLGLRQEIENLLTQGRSKKLSILVGMQRPAQVSRFSLSECTHFFVFRVEGRDLKTVMESSSPRMKEAVQSLTGHDFAYYNRVTQGITVGNANELRRIFRNLPPKG